MVVMVTLMKESSGSAVSWPARTTLPRIGETILVGDSPTRYTVTQVDHYLDSYDAKSVQVEIWAVEA